MEKTKLNTNLIKSLIVSQLNHLFITLPKPNDKTINQLNDISFKI